MPAHLLLVEDDELLLEQLTETLLDANYSVTAAASSQQALEWASLGKPLDLVLTDVRMAGLDGIAAFARLREERPGLRGIIMTGYASPDAPRRAVSAGVWDYLYKPFNEEDLLASVERVLALEQKIEEQRQTLASRLWEGARRWLLRMQGHGLARLRDRVWWAFHAGIRSRLLQRSEALAVYDELEQLERRALELDQATLEAGYHKVLSLIEGLKNDSVMLYWETPRQPDQVPREQFDKLFGHIKRGDLAGHQLPLAVAVRTLPATADAEQRALHATFWG